ncbi:uncharacterized protein BKA78DRAFT_352224 [Phyllosticta capitalensis]|uniref:uncharacterized protein n=1 Tax=Phyllosticta capitalensis TaxID=121624 RepID=UPI00312EB1FA
MKRATRDRRLDALGDAVVAFAGSLARRADARAWRRAQGPARRELERMQWQARRQREVQETRRLFDECERDETIPPLLRCAVRALRRVADDMGYLGRRPSVLGLTCRFIVIGGAWMVVFGLLGRLAPRESRAAPLPFKETPKHHGSDKAPAPKPPLKPPPRDEQSWFERFEQRVWAWLDRQNRKLDEKEVHIRRWLDWLEKRPDASPRQKRRYQRSRSTLDWVNARERQVRQEMQEELERQKRQEEQEKQEGRNSRGSTESDGLSQEKRRVWSLTWRLFMILTAVEFIYSRWVYVPGSRMPQPPLLVSLGLSLGPK